MVHGERGMHSLSILSALSSKLGLELPGGVGRTEVNCKITELEVPLLKVHSSFNRKQALQSAPF